MLLAKMEKLEKFQTHILEELEFHFDVLRISETKISNSNVDISTPFKRLMKHLKLHGQKFLLKRKRM